MSKIMRNGNKYGGTASSMAKDIVYEKEDGTPSNVQEVIDEQNKKFEGFIRVAQFKAEAKTIAQNGYAEYTLTLQSGSIINSDNIKEYYPIGFRQLGISGSNLAFFSNYRYDDINKTVVATVVNIGASASIIPFVTVVFGKNLDL